MSEAVTHASGFADVLVLRLPAAPSHQFNYPLSNIGVLATKVAQALAEGATLVTIGNTVDLVAAQASIESVIRYQSWITIKRTEPQSLGTDRLPEQHFGALIHTKYASTLRHTKTRIQYTYCPACDKTTKDYGGKKHTYHEYGTLVSDVWRDVACDLEGDITPILLRLADLFGLGEYKELRVVDCRPLPLTRAEVKPISKPKFSLETSPLPRQWVNQLVTGDCLNELRKIPENSIDFAFADPPYNLKKNYTGYRDDLAVAHYFDWCDEWIAELARALKPGRTLALLNIPLWSVRHFLHLQTLLNFQNWITWDALSFPVRLLMPAHYAILCFSKGEPRPLPGFISTAQSRVEPAAGLRLDFTANHQLNSYLAPLDEGFCLRAQCVNYRRNARINDRGTLTDLWWDIHRLKHNTRRVDHPCQLPPQLMYRLISLFTKKGEMVLDCFNGAGTTTLAAHQLGRNYLGLEKENTYTQIALSRHDEIAAGLDPFRKVERVLTAKNSPVPRLLKQKYEVPKKTLQLEVKRVAKILEKLPTRAELIAYGKYPIRFYDDYFVSWGEVCAAARTTGMTENRVAVPITVQSEQLSLLDISA